MFLRCSKCHKTCGNVLEGAGIPADKWVGFPFLSGGVLVFMLVLRKWWHLRISCVQICSPSTRKERLGLEKVRRRAVSVCRRAGNFLMGQGCNCSAGQSRDWREVQSSVVAVEPRAPINRAGSNLDWKYKGFVPWHRAALSLGCDPEFSLGKAIPGGAGGLLVLGVCWSWGFVALWGRTCRCCFPVSPQFMQRTRAPRLALYHKWAGHWNTFLSEGLLSYFSESQIR